VEALSGLAQAYVLQKQPASAIAAVSAQITKYPKVGGFYYTLGALQVQTRDRGAASASFQKAIELDSGNFAALFQLGRLDMAQGDLDAAAQQWRAWLEKDPRNPNPAWLLGRLEDSRNNWEKAQDYYQKALQARTDFPPAANDLAYSMLVHGGNSDVALTLAQTARRGLPDNPNSADTLALAYIQKKVYGSAIDLLQDAIKKSPPNATFEYHLGLAYQQDGNAAEAKKHLTRALSVDPKFAQAADAKKALQEL
jgi:tetratricopeptide (TPR) repeat protein